MFPQIPLFESDGCDWRCVTKLPCTFALMCLLDIATTWMRPRPLNLVAAPSSMQHAVMRIVVVPSVVSFFALFRFICCLWSICPNQQKISCFACYFLHSPFDSVSHEGDGLGEHWPDGCWSLVFRLQIFGRDTSVGTNVVPWFARPTFGLKVTAWWLRRNRN